MHLKALHILPLLALLGIAWTLDMKQVSPALFADEAVYHSMTQSIACDRDLKFQRRDLARFCKDYPNGPQGIILKQGAGGEIFFAKPFVFPLVAAPFYRLFGLNGYLILNVLAGWGTLMLLVRFWENRRHAGFFIVTALGVSAFFPYIFWIHPEMLGAFMISGFVFSLARAHHYTEAKRKTFHIRTAFILLSLLTFMKPPYILFGCVPLYRWLRTKSWRPLRQGVVAFIGASVILASLSILWTHSIDPYSGRRKIFVNEFPFETEGKAFEVSGDEWSTESASFHFLPRVFFTNIFFLFLGRFTGLTWYFFPGMALLGFLLVRRQKPVSPGFFLLFWIFLLLQVLMIPSNYHGGGGALGNRYFIPLYPLMFFMIPPPRNLNRIIAISVVSSVFSGIFLVQSFAASYHPSIPAQSKLFRRFPPEWTLVNNLPLFDPGSKRVKYTGADAEFFFLTKGIWGSDSKGFQVRGNGVAECFIVTPRETNLLTLQLARSIAPCRFKIRARGSVHSGAIRTGETRSERLTMKPEGVFIDIYGRKRWAYHITIECFGGGIPKFLSGSRDVRYLGFHVTPRI